VVLGRLRAGGKTPGRQRGTQAPKRGEDPVVSDDYDDLPTPRSTLRSRYGTLLVARGQ
jgi:hypothetical protein